jgi:hypothetical protein
MYTGTCQYKRGKNDEKEKQKLIFDRHLLSCRICDMDTGGLLC